MKAFAELFAQLDQTNKTNEKVRLMTDYFRTANEADKLWVVALFSGRRPKRKVKISLVRQWAAELAGISDWLFDESYQVVGDLAETISLVLPPSETQNEKSLTEWLEFLQELGEKEKKKQKEAVCQTLLSLNQQERFIFIKLMSGGFRIGISQNLMIKALGAATGIDTAQLNHRLMGNWTPQTTTYKKLVLEQDENEDLSRPYPFCLAHPIEGEVSDLGDASEWMAEWKWDGIRGQIVFRKGELYVWSRGEELVTDKFPEFQVYKNCLPKDVVLDGEILAFKDGGPLPFSDLQTRLNRKNVSKSLVEKAPVIFKAYDLLEINQRDCRNQPFRIRRQMLEDVLNFNKTTSLQLSPLLGFRSWETLSQIRNNARKYYAEGLMLKRKSSAYHVGRKKGDWWKWKTDPFTIDGVLLYAQKGHGRRAGLYTDYTFGVWNKGELVVFAKAYSGLSDEEFRQVDAFIRKNTREKFGPVRTVKPELVFEIAFEGIQQSNRHKSGVALRFPRMFRWRKEKKAEEADTLNNLLALIP